MEHESRRLASRMIGIALEEISRVQFPAPDDPPRHDYEIEALNYATRLLVSLMEELDKTTGRPSDDPFHCPSVPRDGAAGNVRSASQGN